MPIYVCKLEDSAFASYRTEIEADSFEEAEAEYCHYLRQEFGDELPPFICLEQGEMMKIDAAEIEAERIKKEIE